MQLSSALLYDPLFWLIFYDLRVKQHTITLPLIRLECQIEKEKSYLVNNLTLTK